jgi:Flp pilus assembly protein TadB
MGFILGLFLVALAYFIEKKKAYDLISGYNTMSKKKQAAIDIAGIARMMRQTFTWVAIGLSVVELVMFWYEHPFLRLLQALIVVFGVIVLIIRSNNKRFRQNSHAREAD